MAAKIYFICGFVCSGKTTFAKQIAANKPAFRFSIDEWMIPLYGEHMSRQLFDERLGTLQELFKDAALQMVNLGVSVIFDFGFWKLAHRNSIREWADINQLDWELIYIESDFDECSKRAAYRNSMANDKSYEMTAEMLSLFWSWFESPINENATTISMQSVP
jgi:predicted kinase